MEDKKSEEFKRKKKEYAKVYYSKPEKRDLAKDRLLRTQYGLTLLDYRGMLQKQGHKCKVCPRTIKEGTAYVDHCHKTGRVRGILCNNCNLAIGHLQEDLNIAKSLVKYLTENE